MIIYYNGRKFVFHEFEILVRNHGCQNELLVGICGGSWKIVCIVLRNQKLLMTDDNDEI